MATHPYLSMPAFPFTLSEGEILRRPEAVARLTFDHVFDFPGALWEWRDRASLRPAFARSIVPLELAQAGDDQVVVYGRAGERHTAPTSLDALADLPGVSSVVAGRPVLARRPLPQIRELYVLDDLGAMDEETLRNLPGLVSLSLGKGWSREKIDLEVLRGMPGLRDLQFLAASVRSIEPLRFLERLERLEITGIAAERNVAPLAGLKRLRWLALQCWRGLRHLAGLENLERVSLMGVSLSDMKAFRAWGKVRSLALSERGVRSLEGIGALAALEELFLGGAGVRDLAPLAGVAGLRRLKLAGADRVDDWGPIGRLRNLQSLLISMGSISDVGHVPSIDFLAGLGQLQEFELMNALVDDGRLDALAGLPGLRRVRLLGEFGPQVERLRRRLPACTIDVIRPPDDQAEAIQVGALSVCRREEGSWFIMQDLTRLLRVDDNWAAERRVRRAIAQQDPGLLGRLAFDSDADFVSISAGSEADIRRAAEVIQALA